MYIYFLYWVFVVLLMYQWHKRIMKRYEAPVRPFAWLYVLSMLATFYYMSTMAFAFTVYPFIPAAKGGGNYVYSRDVNFMFKPEIARSLPPALFSHETHLRMKHGGNASAFESVRLKILEETNTAFFVASADDPRCQPNDWTFWKTPAIFVVPRERVDSMVELPSETP
jgi:hypothetical protein